MEWLNKLKEMKKLSGKTSKEIAEATGIPKSTIDKLFSGQTKEPYLSSVRAIVHYLGYTLDDLEDPPIKKPDISDHEKKLISAYRKKKSMQQAVDTLLGINDENEDNESSIAADQSATIRAANAFTPVTIKKK